jgi:Fe-S cluster assembly iron-binding protein IscA
MFEVSEKAKEKVKEFLAGREEASPIRIMPYSGG